MELRECGGFEIVDSLFVCSLSSIGLFIFIEERAFSKPFARLI
jgi:hypothetical protein